MDSAHIAGTGTVSHFPRDQTLSMSAKAVSPCSGRDRRRLLSLGELLQREGVAHISQRFVAGKANCLVQARLELLFAVKNRVVPSGVSQHLRDILAPTLTARHRRVLQELVAHKESVSAHERFIFGIKFCRIDLNK